MAACLFGLYFVRAADSYSRGLGFLYLATRQGGIASHRRKTRPSGWYPSGSIQRPQPVCYKERLPVVKGKLAQQTKEGGREAAVYDGLKGRPPPRRTNLGGKTT
jgi:hypothetical protein